MSSAILFGLAAAVCYGAANVVARFSGRSLGVLATLVWSQSFLLICASAAALRLGMRLEGSVGNWAGLAASNLAIIVATGCLYRGLAVGRLSVVAPVMASYGAVGAGLSLLTGEPATPFLLIGLSLTVVGAILSALPSDTKSKTKPSAAWLAVSSAVFFGLGYWLQGRFVLPNFGPVSTVWLYYLTSTILFSLTALFRRAPILAFDGPKDIGWLFTTALLGGSGFVATVLAQSDGDIAVASAVSSSATGITVLLAFLFLHDKPSWKGWLGVASVISGVVILQLDGS